MSFAFTHLIAGWLAGKGYERFLKLDRYAWFLLLFGAVLPDADFLFDWTLGTHLHRTFTHSVLFVAVGFAVVWVVSSYLHRTKRTMYGIALATGIFTHLLLDFFSAQGIPLLWPGAWYFSYLHIGLYDGAKALFAGNLAERLRYAILDMALGTAWIFYLWWKKNLKF